MRCQQRNSCGRKKRKPTEDRPRNLQRWQSTAQPRAEVSAWTSCSTIEPSEASSSIEMTCIQFDVADPPFVLVLVLSEAVLVLDWVLRRRVRNDRHGARRAAGSRAPTRIRVGVRVPACGLSTSTISYMPERLKSRGNGFWVSNYRNAPPVAPVHFVVLAFGSGYRFGQSGSVTPRSILPSSIRQRNFGQAPSTAQSLSSATLVLVLSGAVLSETVLVLDRPRDHDHGRRSR